jgi:release factor glutamine methyltransferase
LVDEPARIGALLEWATDGLTPRHDTARLDAEVLLAWVLDKTRAQLHGWPEEPVAPQAADYFSTLIARRAAGEPVAYITGTREFWSLTLRVTPDTLIPRPETEHLVEAALTHIPVDADMRIVDLGAGSGAVALALATERLGCRVWATEVSGAAMAVVAENVARLGLDNVILAHGDWCDALRDRIFSVIVSNPPYIPDADPHLGEGDVAFEPRLALAAGADGLDAIRHIAANAPRHLEPGGVLLLEHGYDQAMAVQAVLQDRGFTDIHVHKDLARNDRITEARSPRPL